MVLDFEQMDVTELEHFKGGEKSTLARMMVDNRNKIMLGRLVPGASIGVHTHETGSEIIYILQGTGKALCDGADEELRPGLCHYCPRGHTHGVRNDGTEDLVFFAVVPEQE